MMVTGSSFIPAQSLESPHAPQKLFIIFILEIKALTSDRTGKYKRSNLSIFTEYVEKINGQFVSSLLPTSFELVIATRVFYPLLINFFPLLY